MRQAAGCACPPRGRRRSPCRSAPGSPLRLSRSSGDLERRPRRYPKASKRSRSRSSGSATERADAHRVDEAVPGRLLQDEPQVVVGADRKVVVAHPAELDRLPLEALASACGRPRRGCAAPPAARAARRSPRNSRIASAFIASPVLTAIGMPTLPVHRRARRGATRCRPRCRRGRGRRCAASRCRPRRGARPRPGRRAPAPSRCRAPAAGPCPTGDEVLHQPIEVPLRLAQSGSPAASVSASMSRYQPRRSRKPSGPESPAPARRPSATPSHCRAASGA